MQDIALDRRLIVALDTADRASALDLYRRTKSVCAAYKVGLQLFTATGMDLVHRLRGDGADVFLDLKLHDIPNTMAGAVAEIAKQGVALTTVHALSGKDAMVSAVGALSGATTLPGASPTQLLAVTVLTHHTGESLARLGLPSDPATSVKRLLQEAMDASMHGCVCSPEEAAMVRSIVDEDFLIVCPGIRPEGAPLGDQARTATPYEAVASGADRVVVGRPIRMAANPGEVAASILEDIERGLAERERAA